MLNGFLYIYIYDFMKKGTIKDFNFFNNDRFFTKENLITKNKFCNFIASGNCVDEGTFRDKFVKELMKYKKVDCPGTRFNNMEKLYGSSNNGLEASLYKREFIKNYKFTIGFENTSTLNGYNGYTTEKFIEPLVSNTLLLYYGNINIDKEFNTKSFLNYHDYNSIDKFIERIIELDNNDDLYLEYMNEKYSSNNKYFNYDYLLSILEKFIKSI